MLLVALVALGLFAWQELRDGMPPRFVVRGIPARIAKLKPGMTYEEAKEILGLEKSWLRGGTSAMSGPIEGSGLGISMNYAVRPNGPWIHLRFTRYRPEEEPNDPLGLKSVRLADAHFYLDGRPITMPK